MHAEAPGRQEGTQLIPTEHEARTPPGTATERAPGRPNTDLGAWEDPGQWARPRGPSQWAQPEGKRQHHTVGQESATGMGQECSPRLMSTQERAKATFSVHLRQLPCSHAAKGPRVPDCQESDQHSRRENSSGSQRPGDGGSLSAQGMECGHLSGTGQPGLAIWATLPSRWPL